MKQSSYVFLVMILIILVASSCCYEHFEYELSDHLPSQILVESKKNGSSEEMRMEKMLNIKEFEYVDMNSQDSADKSNYCTICGASIEAAIQAAKQQKHIQKDNIKEGFIGYSEGPGEVKVPRNPVTGEKCCPVCFEQVTVGKEKKCKEVCSNGTHQDYSCLNVEQQASFKYYIR